MKGLWIAGLLTAVPLMANADPLATMPAAEPFSVSVFEAHDKFPHRISTRDIPGEHECSEPPDGDHNCDDPKGVPEPGTLGTNGLLMLGVGGVAFSMWRRKK